MKAAQNVHRRSSLPGWALFVPLFLTLSASPVCAGGFYVVPTTMDLGKGAKSGTFSVVNSGDAKMDFQVSIKAWTQEADGRDVYAETPDLVFFPKIMTIEPHDQRAIRVGIKGVPPAREKAYRIFVEEIPRAGTTSVVKIQQGDVSGAIAFAYRFSIPIFWKPSKEQAGGVLEKVEMTRGVARAVVGNAGNIHVKVPSVIFRGVAGDGRELFSKELNGWYILQGLSRAYEFQVPPELCAMLATIEVRAKTEKKELDGILNVQKEMCTP